MWGEGVFRNSLGCVFGFVYFFKIFRFSSAVFAKFESVNTLNPAALSFFFFFFNDLKKLKYRTSLMVQWLRLCVPSAGGLGFNPWSGN